MIEMLVSGFAAVLNPGTVLFIFSGVVIGIIFGAIPGLTATMAIALGLPLTYGLNPVDGMSLLLGLYIGGVSGGLISAIMLNIPGTPSSIATTFDGYPMAQRGEAGKALGTGIVFSFMAGVLSISALIFISPPLARFALRFGNYEYFAVALFALTMVGSLSGKSMIKGLISGSLGVFFGMFGFDPIGAFPRFTFGWHELSGGFSLLPVLVGLFAVPQLFMLCEGSSEETRPIQNFKIKGFGFTLKEFYGQLYNWFRSTLIGIGIGILPGVGASTSNLVAWLTAKKRSKYPEKFGTGVMDGIVAAESANNGTVGGALIPLITLGIPGDAATAMLLGGLMLHGLIPGPMLFTRNGDIIFSIFAGLILANFIMLITEFYGIRIFVRLLKIPKRILLPVIIVLCVVGAIGLNNRVFDAISLLFFGLVGYLMEKFELPLPPVVLGFILGPMIEINLRRGIMSSQGSIAPFFTEPISLLFLVATLISILYTVYAQMKKKTI
jgi:putative tricarboxylic transport membrane protein